jgi:hypothetical protein
MVHGIEAKAMTDYTLTLPEDIYDHVRRIAEEADQPVEQLILDRLRSMTMLPAEEQAELDALRYLSDDTLRTIAREQMPLALQERMQVLMEKNNFGTISPSEYEELEALVERGNRLMLRKAEAAGILMDHGHPFSQDDFKPL